MVIKTMPKRPWELPNAPKFQPCPKCHGRSKRVEKLAGGANYYCRKCQETFFVPYPSVSRGGDQSGKG